MRTEPSVAVERYLDSHGLRYFRGRHDGEYFFILTVGHERLHVHFEVVPGTSDILAVRVAPGHFFPATDRGRLVGFARSWNADDSARAAVLVYESSDPTRIGVAAQSWCRLDHEDLPAFADKTVRWAVKIFAELPPAPESMTPTRTCAGSAAV